LPVVLNIAELYGLNCIQLHGSEPTDYCTHVKASGYEVWKAFGICDGFDWQKLAAYENACDYFLFDTSTVGHGGSGQKFDWGELAYYNLSRRFFLSGGIGPEDAEMVRNMQHPLLAGIDINSRFEDAPALKNIEKLTQFLNVVRA
jgi:phosphoribosylanthranilate isomerase